MTSLGRSVQQIILQIVQKQNQKHPHIKKIIRNNPMPIHVNSFSNQFASQ